MRTIEIARRLAGHGEVREACKAFALAIHEEGSDPAERMEGAMYILQSGDGEVYKIAYDCFLTLHRQGYFQQDCFQIMTEGFYLPNLEDLRVRYEENCRALKGYSYLFRKDFLPFEELPIRFYPYDDTSHVPFDPKEERFSPPIDFCRPVVSRNFFRDLEQPILAADVFSQYELEYLKDNVRKSEWVGRENHIYLHYTDWGTFCAYLQCLDWGTLLEEEKFVILIGDEIGQYPIDFKERFGIDYSQYPLKPVGIREVNRLIWHTQLSTHNGGDFFNEVFDGHPNLLYLSSIMFEDLEGGVRDHRLILDEYARSLEEAQAILEHWENPRLVKELYELEDRTDKDILVALYFAERVWSICLDQASRISPALFMQPHFGNILYKFQVYEGEQTVLYSEEAEQIYQSPLFRDFQYIKTFTPLRRFTTSHAATVRFMHYQHRAAVIAGGKQSRIPDVITQRALNRSFMIDRENRLFKDSVLVRFEDAKLNPKATFTALAAFVDLPYTESMTCCSFCGQPYAGGKGSGLGFDTASVYRTYDDFINTAERCFLEYFLRDAYEYYGYDFQYYDGASMDEAQIKALINNFTTMDDYIRKTYSDALKQALMQQEGEPVSPEEAEKTARDVTEKQLGEYIENRVLLARTLLKGLRFVDRKGRPLAMMPMLKLDPALLERPVYR